MHQLPGFRDAEDLKWKVATDAQVIRSLASFAHMLGFGWCGGTRSQGVGEDFDVWKEGDRYIQQAHYGSNDPYAGGYWADKRLRMTLSNFEIVFDPGSFVYGTPVIREMQPISISSYLARNESEGEDNISKTFAFQLTESLTHTTSNALTVGLKIGTKAAAKIPFFGDGEVSTEFSFSNTTTWTDSTATVTGQTDTSTYTGRLPGRSQRLIRLVANRVSSDITYRTLAKVSFDIEFYGFLRWSGNARADHPENRPFQTVQFGNSTYRGLDDIWDKWTHRDIPGYWQGWDWGWMQKNFGGWLEGTMNFIGGGVGAPVSGKFNNVKGTNVYTAADEPRPLPKLRTAIRSKTAEEIEDPAEAARAATLAAIGEMVDATTEPSPVVPAGLLMQTDELPGGRVVTIG